MRKFRLNKKRRVLWWIAGGILLALVAVVFWPQPVPVETALVTRGPLTVSVFEEGKTRIRHRYTISAPVAGFLDRVPLRAGDRIEAGKTVVATLRAETPGFLDPRVRAQAEARLKASEAARDLRETERDRAEALLDLAKTQSARADRLIGKNAISRQEWEIASNLVQVRGRERNAADFALQVAGFEVEQARAALLQADAATAESGPLEIRSPVSGFVLQVHEESARMVTPGTPILEAGDPSDLEAEIEMLSSDAVAVREGAEVSIEHWGGDKALRGRVTKVEPGAFTKISALGVEEQRVRVRVEFADEFPPGQEPGDRFRVEARIVIWQADEVLQVPTGALFRYGDDWMTFAVRDGKARRHRVEIGRFSGTAAQVLDGLAENDLVVLHPPDTLADGSAVRSEP